MGISISEMQAIGMLKSSYRRCMSSPDGVLGRGDQDTFLPGSGYDEGLGLGLGLRLALGLAVGLERTFLPVSMEFHLRRATLLHGDIDPTPRGGQARGEAAALVRV